jgi:hypothetical protein
MFRPTSSLLLLMLTLPFLPPFLPSFLAGDGRNDIMFSCCCFPNAAANQL